MQDDVEALVAGLTKAQAEAITAGRMEPSGCEVRGRSATHLVRKGLAVECRWRTFTGRERPGFRLTPLGLRVCDALRASQEEAMTDTAQIEALVARIEAAGGPSAEERQLVIDAYNLLFPHELSLPIEDRGDDETRYARTMHRVRFSAHINTDYERASFDAVVMMVPEGFMWRLQSWPDGVNNAILEKDAGDFGAIDARHTDSFATTPALALCAASLKARVKGGI